MDAKEVQALADKQFMDEVREARSEGFAYVCSECGVGMYGDDFDPEGEDVARHNGTCSHNPDYERNMAAARAWAEQQRAKAD